LEQRYEAIVSFLQSPDSKRLRIEAERYYSRQTGNLKNKP